MSKELVFNALALVGAGTCTYWLFRGLAAFLRMIQPPPETDAAAVAPSAAASAPVATSDDIAADHIAVIAAAVYSMLDSHRIVHIEDSHSGIVWSAEGRWQHQTSHRTH
jgi:hypothetical protein